MLTRRPIAQGFYPDVGGVCKLAVERHLENGDKIQANIQKENVVAGIVPHAGWIYSGDTASTVFSSISRLSRPDVFFLFGSVHVMGVEKPSIMREGIWETPIGELEIDADLASDILKSSGDLLVENVEGHLMEHSLEVQAPFIKYLFPEASIVPIMVPPVDEATILGERVAALARNLGKAVMAIGTSDLTHYGQRYALRSHGTGKEALDWVKNENDKRIIDLCLKMSAEEIVPDATKHMNACGGGALAATVAYARALGIKEGELLQYTTSYDVEPTGQPTDFVGYAGIVF
ncbi:MAG: AmmeMemoRadiSam system protein B [Candidatus Brocadiales bacterium]